MFNNAMFLFAILMIVVSARAAEPIFPASFSTSPVVIL